MVSCIAIYKKGNREIFEKWIQRWEGLHEFHVSAERNFADLSYILFSTQTCLYDYQKTNGRFCALPYLPSAALKRGPIKIVSATVYLGQRYVHGWVKFILQQDDKHVKICKEGGTRNRPQNITEHDAFRRGKIMFWAGIYLGYCTDLHIFRWISITAVRYRDEIWDHTVRFDAAVVMSCFGFDGW